VDRLGGVFLPIEKICVNCGKAYKVKPSKAKSKYCSQKCSIEHQRGQNAHTWRGGKEIGSCKYCGKEFEYWPGCQSGEYCSQSCAKKTWSKEDEATLIKMHSEGKTISEMAVALSRTEEAIKGKRYCMGLSYRKKWGKEDIELLKKNHKQEISIKDIAKLLNTTVGAVEAQITKYGLGAAPGSEEFSKKASKRNKKLWNDPDHIFNHPEYRDKLKAHWENPDSPFNSRKYRQALSDNAKKNKAWHLSGFKKGRNRYKSGYRPDLGFYVRSGWEANIARYLKFLVEKKEIKGFKYEADTFEFHEIKRGTRSYTPDFKIFKNDGSVEYWEVKGYMDKQSKTRLKRMAKYYPGINIKIIDKDQYNEIKKWSRLIIGWDDDGLEIIAEIKLEIINFLEDEGWFVIPDTPYQLYDEICIGVIHIMALKNKKHILIEVVPDRFAKHHIKSGLQLAVESAGLEYVLARCVEDVEHLGGEKQLQIGNAGKGWM